MHKNSVAFTFDQKALPNDQENDTQQLQKASFTLKETSTKTPDFVQFTFRLQKSLNRCLSFSLSAGVKCGYK